MSGRYVGFEGVEGAGKSTVVGAVASRLEKAGGEVVIVREPGGTPIGEDIRRLLLHSEAMSDWTEAALFAAARAELVRVAVAPALSRGAYVLSDRTYYSSLAYQGVGRGLGVEAVRSLNTRVLEGVVPDVVVVLDVDPAVGFARETDRDRIGGEGLAFQQKVADAYRSIANHDERVVLIDASQPTAEVVQAVLEVISQ